MSTDSTPVSRSRRMDPREIAARIETLSMQPQGYKKALKFIQQCLNSNENLSYSLQKVQHNLMEAYRLHTNENPNKVFKMSIDDMINAVHAMCELW